MNACLSADIVGLLLGWPLVPPELCSLRVVQAFVQVVFMLLASLQQQLQHHDDTQLRCPACGGVCCSRLDVDGEAAPLMLLPTQCIM